MKSDDTSPKLMTSCKGLLATFLDIAGRKLDKADDAKEHPIQDFQHVLLDPLYGVLSMYPTYVSRKSKVSRHNL